MSKAPTSTAAKNTATTAATSGKPARTAPELTAVSNSIPIPARVSNRGSKSLYDFDKLTVVGMSFGVLNKTAKQMGSIVSNANRKGVTEKRDAMGNTVFKTKPVDAGGGQITHVPTQEPEMITVKHFVVADVDPKTDPDKASVRIWRDK